MEFPDAMETVARWFEVAGVVVFVLGAVWTAVRAFADWRNDGPIYLNIRRHFGQSLILGLEILVAADIIKTVTVETTLENVTALGILVLVRTLLSFSLNVEITGVLPWQRAAFEAQRSTASSPDVHLSDGSRHTD